MRQTHPPAKDESLTPGGRILWRRWALGGPELNTIHEAPALLPAIALQGDQLQLSCLALLRQQQEPAVDESSPKYAEQDSPDVKAL